MTALRLLLAAAGRRAGSNQQMFPVVCNALAQPLLQDVLAAAPQQQHPTLLQLAQSSFHTSTAVPSAAQTLSSVLAKEIKHEKTVYEKDDLVAKGPPAPFLLHSAVGDTAVSLTRDYQGEKISVDCSVNMQDSLAAMAGLDEDGEEDEEADEVNDVNFNVTVTRGDKALVFECISDGTYVDIKHVSLEPAAGVDSETAYTGPVFPELDSELQSSFRDFLQERGVNEDLGEYLRHLMFDKEQQEYMHWLESVKGFVGSSSS